MKNKLRTNENNYIPNQGKTCIKTVIAFVTLGFLLAVLTVNSVNAQEYRFNNEASLQQEIQLDLRNNGGTVNGQLTEPAKKRIGQISADLVNKEFQRNDHFDILAYSVGGGFPFWGKWFKNKYFIYDNPENNKLSGKQQTAIQRAIRALSENGLNNAPGLLHFMSFNCTDDKKTRTQVVMRFTGDLEGSFIPRTKIYLGPENATATSTTSNWSVARYGNEAQYKQQGFDSYTIGILHMIGHVLYERDQTDRYYELNSKVPQPIAQKVSVYAATDRNEFVAEVFASRMIGRNLDTDVMQEYLRQWNPRSPYN
jgi:hypothetical protein